MAANTSAIFVLTPKRPAVRISVANTGRDGTGTLGTIVTIGANGGFYRQLEIQPEVAIPSGDVVRIYNQVAGSGNNELIMEVPIPVTVPQTSGAGTPPMNPVLPQIIIPFPPGETFGAGDIIKASTDQGKTYSVALAAGGDY